jgi:hypothetical protein
MPFGLAERKKSDKMKNYLSQLKNLRKDMSAVGSKIDTKSGNSYQELFEKYQPEDELTP